MEGVARDFSYSRQVQSLPPHVADCGATLAYLDFWLPTSESSCSTAVKKE